MSKVLYIQASPRGKHSHSIAVADAFLARYRELHPQDEIITRNLFTTEMEPFDGFRMESKYLVMHGQEFTPEHRQAWDYVEKVIEEFKSADKLVLAVPMWNWNIPYKLKHYLDIIMQPTYLFGYTEQGQQVGLVGDKPTFIAYASGNYYTGDSPHAAWDHQKPYLRFILEVMGITDLREVAVEPTLAKGPEVAMQMREKAQAQAVEMAAAF